MAIQLIEFKQTIYRKAFFSILKRKPKVFRDIIKAFNEIKKRKSEKSCEYFLQFTK
jgi:hypothetical protein